MSPAASRKAGRPADDHPWRQQADFINTRRPPGTAERVRDLLVQREMSAGRMAVALGVSVHTVLCALRGLGAERIGRSSATRWRLPKAKRG